MIAPPAVAFSLAGTFTLGKPPPRCASTDARRPHHEQQDETAKRKHGRCVSLAACAKPSSSSSYSSSERDERRERLRSLWRDEKWREAMLAKRRSKESVRKKSESLRRVWGEESFREKMRASQLGRQAPNKGKSASAVTRFRMSVTRKGRRVSDATKERMSLSKRLRPEGDEWPRLISESKKGKTRQYFGLRREFRALHKDLKLWSDSFRARHGRLPDAETFDRFVAPMMVIRIRRYLTLREAIGTEEAGLNTDIFSK